MKRTTFFCDRCTAEIPSLGATHRASIRRSIRALSAIICEATADDVSLHLCLSCVESLNAWWHRESEGEG